MPTPKPADTRTRRISLLTPPPSRSGKTAFLVSCGLMVGVLGLLTLSCAGLTVIDAVSVSPGIALLSMTTAFLFAIPHFLVLMWLDRNEREPIHLVASAWLWGAIVATGLSLVVNTTFGFVSYGILGDEMAADQLTASLSAPFIEELTKAGALVVLYLFFRSDFDSVLDGVFYGAMVGLGFATFENFLYYSGEESVGGVLVLTLLRGAMTSLGSHVCFTAITGASIGVFRVMRRGPLRWFVPPLGLLLAMFVHFSWNTFTGLFTWEDQGALTYLFVSVPLAMTVLQLPFVVLVSIVAFVSFRHERWVIGNYLGSERAPVLLPGEIDRLLAAHRRFVHDVGLLAALRGGDWWLERRRRARLVRLAFEKWHMDAELEGGQAHDGRAHAISVLALRKELALLVPPAPSGRRPSA